MGDQTKYVMWKDKAERMVSKDLDDELATEEMKKWR